MASTIHNRRAAPSTLAGPSIPPRGHDPTSTTPAPMSTEPVVWEAHVTDLIRKDGRWRQVWSLFLNACTIPDDTTTYPGHATQKETCKGKLHREELARCYKDPSAIIDGLAELRQKFLFRHHKWRSSSLPSFLSRNGSNSSSSSSVTSSSSGGSSGSNPSENMSASEWKAHKGRYLRVAPASSVTLLPFPSSSIPSSSPSSSPFIVEDEETQMRELLTTLLSSEMNRGYQRNSENSTTSTSSSIKNNNKEQQQQQQQQERRQQQQSEQLDETDVLSRGFTYFPPHGYQSWCKNAFDKSSSYRLTLVHNVPSGRSSFRYRHPSTGLLHILPAIDGTVRLVRVSISPSSSSSSSSSRGWGAGRAAPVWHCTTAEDGHLWCLSYQLSARAGHQVLRGGCLRPVVPLLPLKLSVEIPPSGEGERGGGRRNGGEEKKRSTTPLAVSFLFGHRRHPLPGQEQMCQQQQQEEEQGGGGVKVPTPSSGGSSKGGSRRNSRNVTLKRSSRNLDGRGGD